MKIGIISEFSPRTCDYSSLKSLKQKNLEIHLFTKTRFKDYYENSVIVTHTYENMPLNHEYILDIIQSHYEKPFDYLIANHEDDLLMAAKIRQFLRIDGQCYNSALDFRDKFVMKSHLSGTVALPNFCKINDSVDLVAFIERNQLPVVVKPRTGAGSSEITIVRTEKDLRKFLKTQIPMGKFMVETFVKGDMYHMDGIFDNGKIKLYTISKYYNTCMAYTDNEPVGSYIVDEKNHNKKSIFVMVRKVLQTLQTPSHAITFHAEVYKQPSHSPVFCEIASRVGGGRIASTFKLHTNVDMQTYYVESQMGIRKEVKSKISSMQQGWIIFPPRVGKLSAVKMLSKPWIKEANFDRPKIGRMFSGAAFNGDALIAYVIEGKNEAELLTRMKYVERFQKENTEYIPMRLSK